MTNLAPVEIVILCAIGAAGITFFAGVRPLDEHGYGHLSLGMLFLTIALFIVTYLEFQTN